MSDSLTRAAFLQKTSMASAALLLSSIELFAKEEEKIIKIRAEIIVIRDSQKGIIIGHQGKALKKVGTEARKDMEGFLQKQVFLELFVKVNKDWRNNAFQLRRFGYNQK